ncbi:MAG: TonB-dependent receptor [Betaproteobacteria bacterium]|nr:TonB-dependent receptor [Betaproteobacteria bacterium]
MKNVFCTRLRQMALGMLSAVCLSGFAQEPQGTLKEVVVTATRSEQGLEEVKPDVTVITRADIESLGLTSLSQVLSRLPGVQGTSSGGGSHVFIRGAESRMTSLLIDGVRVDLQDGQSIGGGAPWDLVPMNIIDRVEVVKGPQSALYGSDAMGGVVQVFTRKPTEKSEISANLGYGTFNTKQAGAFLGGKNGPWDYSFNVYKLDSDGFNTRPDLKTAKTTPTEAAANSSGSMRLGLAINPGHRVDYTYLSSVQNARSVPWNGGIDYFNQNKLDTSSIKLTSVWSDTYTTDAMVTYGLSRKTSDNPYAVDYSTSNKTLLLNNKWIGSMGSLNFLLEKRSDDFDSAATQSDPKLSSSRAQNGIGLGYSKSIGDHSVQLNTRNDYYDNFGAINTNAFGYGYQLSKAWSLSASSSSGFRSPTLEQQFGPYGSLALKPESSNSQELSLRYVFEKTFFKITTYESKYINLISSSQTLATCAAGGFCYFNIDEANVKGNSIQAQYSLVGIDFSGSLDDLVPINQSNGNDLNLRARRTSNIALTKRFQSWLFKLENQTIGQRFDDAANKNVLSPYQLMNFFVQQKIDKSLTWSLRIDTPNASSVSPRKPPSGCTCWGSRIALWGFRVTPCGLRRRGRRSLGSVRF